jgi:hypothetical protein
MTHNNAGLLNYPKDISLVSSLYSKYQCTMGRLHNKELHALYSSPSIIRVIKSRRLKWAGHVARMGKRRGAYRALVGKPEGRSPLGKPRHRWEENIKKDLREVGWGGGAWTGSIWLRIETGGGLL